jgi:branched-chain amino acid transport system ATP-binding protein
MSNPKLILLDEPSMGLMPAVVNVIFDVIGRLRDQGKTIFLVEQNAGKALEVSQMAALLELGEIVLWGDSRQVARDPKIKECYLGG